MDNSEIAQLDQFVSDDAPICYGILMPGAHVPDGIPVIKVKNIYSGRIHETALLKTSKEIHYKYKRSEINEDDLLLTIRGTTGRVAIVPLSLSGANITQDTARIRVSSDDSSDYLFYALQSPDTQRQVSLNTVGQAVKGINISEVKKLKIFQPPLPEQRKIAKILQTWDRAIATTEKLIDASKQQKKALMQQLLTGKKRFAGFEGEWEELKLSSIADITMGSSPKSSAYNDLCKGLPLIQGNADIKCRRSQPRKFTSEITKECQIGDILLSVRAPVGSIAKSIHHACIGRGISTISAKKNNSQDFLYQWLLWFEPKWEKLSQGSTFEAVNSSDIKSLIIKIPCLMEQQKIAATLTLFDRNIELLEQRLIDLKQEKNALMQQLLTGQRRVNIND